MQRDAGRHAPRRLPKPGVAAEWTSIGHGTLLGPYPIDGILEVRARRRRQHEPNGCRDDYGKRRCFHLSGAMKPSGRMAAELGPRAIGAPGSTPPGSRLAGRRPAGVPIGSARSLPAFGASHRSRSSNTVKTAGTMTNVSRVDVTSPPMTAMAIGDRKSLSPPQPSATGSMPATMATVVITIGLARLCPDS